MRRIHSLAWIGLAGLLFPLQLAQPQPTTPTPTATPVRVVKYEALGEEVAKHRGKVVLVDFWATYCIPCMKSFKHQVALHRLQAKDGLVVISVSVDPLKDREGVSIEAETKGQVQAFLNKQGADFPNLILDEPPAVLEAKLGIRTVPALFVFDRAGRWTRFDEKTLQHDEAGRSTEVEKLVKQYLAQ